MHICWPAVFRRSTICLLAASLFFAAGAIAASTNETRAPSGIKLAMFDFELEDLSAGLGESPADTRLLEQITIDARKMIVSSGRYRLVDTSRADAAAAKGRWLHQCYGCDAGIALKLGAQQSLFGYVTRISRTEYMVRILITDAKTGTILSDLRTGLRLGADYSWGWGVESLINHQLLKENTP